MKKHTPGPWKATKTEMTHNSPAWRIDSETISLLAAMSYDCAEDRDSFGAANARLIAAAPDLLTALEQLVTVATPNQDPLVMFAAIEKARTAIAKATE